MSGRACPGGEECAAAVIGGLTLEYVHGERFFHEALTHLIGSAIGLVVVVRYWTRISPVLLFWVAFVLTRPFGATLGDFLTKPYEKGGLDFGTIGSSAVLAAVLLAMVGMAYYYNTRRVRQVVEVS